MATVAAQDIGAATTGSALAERALPRLLDMRLPGGGDTGLLLVRGQSRRPLHLAIGLPGRAVPLAKALLVRDLLWTMRTGHSTWL